MFSNYLKIAWRNLWKHKTLSFIIISGMAIAFTAALLLSLTAYFELSYDNFHKNSDHLYEVYEEVRHPNEVEKTATMAAPMTPALKNDIGEIAHISRFASGMAGLARYGSKELRVYNRAVDPDFLKMFSFPVIKGNNTDPLGDLYNVVITEFFAKKLFDNADVVGKSIELKQGAEWKAFKVSAVVKDFPDNSSLSFDILTRFELSENYQENKDRWDNAYHELFVQLKDNASKEAFEKRMPAFSQKYQQSHIDELKRDGATPDADGAYIRLRLIPMRDVHFSSISNVGDGVKKFFPYLLFVISGFILFIACVNFMNLSLARSFTRTREIGIRKVLGAMRWQLILQFWGEALIISCFALLLGLGLAYLLLPYYKTNFYAHVSVSMLQSPKLLLYILISFLLITLLAGGYPALFVSALKTIQTVKGKLKTGKTHYLRNSLMVVQFVLSSLLIICTMIAWQQLDYLHNKPLGYDKGEVISIPIGNKIDSEKALELMRNKLAGNPNVVSVSATSMNMGRGNDGSMTTSIVGFDYKERNVRSHWVRVDYDYLKTMNIPLVAGRDFSKAYGLDTAGVLINEKMAQQLGEKDPVGISLPIDSGYHLQVLGVFKDFNFKSLHQEIAPLTLIITRDWPISYIFVRVQPGNLTRSMDLVKKTWAEVNPGNNTLPSFLDDNTNRIYQKESRLSSIFMSGAILTILISCMGLFAIVLLVINQRTKEIGIRKVLGASVPNIITLVSKDFLLLVLLGFLIAAPVAWYLMHAWLADFAYRINISWWVFIVAGLAAILIALFTLSFQTIRAALGNPVKAIRTE